MNLRRVSLVGAGCGFRRCSQPHRTKEGQQCGVVARSGGDGISPERHLLSALCPLCSYANVITYSRRRRGRESKGAAAATTTEPLCLSVVRQEGGVAAAANQSRLGSGGSAALPRAIDSFDGRGLLLPSLFPSYNSLA